MGLLVLDRWQRMTGAMMERRSLLFGSIASSLSVHAAQHESAAKRGRKKNGKKCKKKQKGCKAKSCADKISAPFTIAARWTNADDDHDTFLFVPGSLAPGAHIDMNCNSSDTAGGTLYPFAFVNGDALGPGDEITTITQLMPGRYEYQLQLGEQTAADTVVAQLVKNGKVCRSWRNPANPSVDREIHWRVFAIVVEDGQGRIETIDETAPQASPLTDVCPLGV